jgi:transcription elongation factor GreA
MRVVMEKELIYVTSTEKELLEEKLRHLTTVERKEIAKKLREATSDKSEFEDNLAFETAKIEQGFLEWRIREIEILLRMPTVADSGSSNGIARIGSTVIIQESPGNRETYTIVGTTEANPRSGKVSYRSPLGKALIGCSAGDEVLVDTPSGERRILIVTVD